MGAVGSTGSRSYVAAGHIRNLIPIRAAQTYPTLARTNILPSYCTACTDSPFFIYLFFLFFPFLFPSSPLPSLLRFFIYCLFFHLFLQPLSVCLSPLFLMLCILSPYTLSYHPPRVLALLLPAVPLVLLAACRILVGCRHTLKHSLNGD